jgi:NADH:ubiquinone oxidoreductase subunit E
VSLGIDDSRLDDEGEAGTPNRRHTTAPVPRFAHGSRVPGWDESVDLSKGPAVIPDRETTPVPPELRTEIEEAMAKYPDPHSAAIPALHAAQKLHGWCSPRAIHQVAAVMQVTPAYLTSIATFYDMLENRPEPIGHHDVYVCTNISCSLRGADRLLDAMVAAAAEVDLNVHVRSFECLGACDIAPMASVDGEYIGPLTPKDAERVVADLREGRPVLPGKQLRYRKSADPGVDEASDLHRPSPGAPIELTADEAAQEKDDA